MDLCDLKTVQVSPTFLRVFSDFSEGLTHIVAPYRGPPWTFNPCHDLDLVTCEQFPGVLDLHLSGRPGDPFVDEEVLEDLTLGL